MPKYLFLLVLLPLSLLGEYHATISRVDTSLEARMIKGGSWHRGCPVPLHDLRYLRMRYHDFQGNDRIGEMIVHKEVAKEVTQIFARLYAWGYPIRRMHLVSDFGGNDWQSIEADNTSAFNCRNATGSKRWSKHSYGKAIDLNPIENPYISRSGRISHKASLPYQKRMHRGEDAAAKAILLKESKAVKLFKSYRWKWGGDWHGVKDYQHFYK
ncbi:MAG: M15 family metallopeptidase [Sulfurovum sp.]|nr:M15 family metallopeptidase [Sulfurovum sp.]